MPQVFLSQATLELLKPFAEPFEPVDVVVAKATRLAAQGQLPAEATPDMADHTALRTFSPEDPPPFCWTTLKWLTINGVKYTNPRWIDLSDAAIQATYETGGLDMVCSLVTPSIFRGTSPTGTHHYLAALDLHYHGFSAQRTWDIAYRVARILNDNTLFTFALGCMWDTKGKYPGIIGRLSVEQRV